MTEPEFVLLDEPVPAPGDPQVRPLRPLRLAGRHGVRKSVFIRIDGYPHRRRLLVLALLVAVVGAATAVVVIRRRKSQDQHDRGALVLEEENDTLAMREPPISAV